MEDARSCLILDDQVSLKDALQYKGEEIGLRIHWACNIAEAVLILEKENIALALVDVKLLGTDDSHQFVRDFLITRGIAYFRWSNGDLHKIPHDVCGLPPGPFDKLDRKSVV